jgi:tetratricopeptide (TPR) repeat protein
MSDAPARPLRLDEVRRVLPDLDEVRPALDFLVTASRPDEAAAWSGSAELATVDARLVDGDLLEAEAERLGAAEAEHLRVLYTSLGRAVGALARGDRSACARALLEAAQLEEDRDRHARAKAYAKAAYEISVGERDQGPAALALRRRARAARALGELEDALAAYAQSHDTALAIGDARGAAEAAVGAGNTLEEQGRWAEAETWYRAALDALADEPEAVPERWHALLTLHIVMRSRGDVERSVPLLEEAARVATLVEGEAALPFLENARGQLRMSEGAFADAEAHFRTGLVHARSARARVTIGVNLAESLLAQGRTLDAAEQARIAEREAIAAGLIGRLPEVYRMLGRIASEDGNEDAFVLFERALAMVRERELPVLEEAITLQAYAAAEQRRGDPETARSLQQEAARRFADLGITHERRTWSDVFAPESEPLAQPQQDVSNV